MSGADKWGGRAERRGMDRKGVEWLGAELTGSKVDIVEEYKIERRRGGARKRETRQEESKAIWPTNNTLHGRDRRRKKWKRKRCMEYPNPYAI